MSAFGGSQPGPAGSPQQPISGVSRQAASGGPQNQAPGQGSGQSAADQEPLETPQVVVALLAERRKHGKSLTLQKFVDDSKAAMQQAMQADGARPSPRFKRDVQTVERALDLSLELIETLATAEPVDEATESRQG